MNAKLHLLLGGLIVSAVAAMLLSMIICSTRSLQ
jgi:hypothetical protein